MATTIDRRSWRVILLCGLVQAVGGGLGWSLVPALMPLIAVDLGLSHARGGFVWGSAALGIALASPFGGAAVDRFGPRRVATAALVAGGLACAGRALVTSGAGLAAAMFVFGLHVGFTAPAIPKVLASYVAPEQLGRANGLSVLFYTVGTAITVLIGRTVLAPALGGWRALMVLAGALMVVIAVPWFALLDDRVALSRHASITDSIALAKHRQMLRVAVMHFLLFGGYLAMLGFLPRALAEAGFAPQAAATAVAGWLLAAGVANFAGPWISDRLGLRRRVILWGAMVAAAALLLLAVSPVSSTPILLVLAALGGGAFAPLLLTLPLEVPGVGLGRAGAALGLLMLVGQAGGFLLPIAVGAIAQGSGSRAALLLLAAVHAAIVLPAVGLRETGRRANEAALGAVAG